VLDPKFFRWWEQHPKGVKKVAILDVISTKRGSLEGGIRNLSILDFGLRIDNVKGMAHRQLLIQFRAKCENLYLTSL